MPSDSKAVSSHSWLHRAVVFVLSALGALELSFQYSGPGAAGGPFWGLVHLVMARPLAAYAPVRGWAAGHPALAAGAAIALTAIALVAFRQALLFWHNNLGARLSGTYFQVQASGFPTRAVDVLRSIARRPKGQLFVGLEPTRGWLGWRWRPVYLSQRQKTMHRHVLGKTGSGKTSSVLFPALLQDALDGKGIVFMDAKGSDENVRAMKGLCAVARRQHDLRVLALPAWNQPQLFTHAYNMVHVRPRGALGPDDPGGDPVPTAERVFSVLPLGDNAYYNTQAQVMFVHLCQLLHGRVDETGAGLPFTLRDIAVCLKGIGSPGEWGKKLQDCLDHSLDHDAAFEVQSHIERLGPDARKCFSGLIGALDKFQAPLVNAYQPDIAFDEVLERNLIVYVQLPANLFRIQAPALGRAILMDIQHEGSLRQVFRQQRNQRPFSVYVDEFANFADLAIIDSLNKLRDANLEYTLAHQSLADLELVSREFAQSVWDNTRTKDILNQDNPELCEKLSKSIGTAQAVSLTVRRQDGALFTSLHTGDASSRLVEEYVLHPNAIKGLARCGQGYLFSDEGLKPVCYGMLPDLTADYGLARADQAAARGLRLYERSGS